MTLALGVLVSGSGSNLQAILDAIGGGELDADCRIVVSNRPCAFALRRAERANVKAVVVDHTQFSTRQEFDQHLITVLKDAGVEWIALAGFMRVLTPSFLNAFEDRVINIHPSLLPAFPGVNAQKQAFDYGVKIAGCTVHFVEQGVDSGPIILQRAVEVRKDDSPESLQGRILEQEHQVFVEALRLIAAGRVVLAKRDDSGGRRRVLIEGAT